MCGQALIAPPVPIGAIEIIVRGDPDYDALIATVVDAGANSIVSDDLKVLAVGEHRGMLILGVNDALGCGNGVGHGDHAQT